ncbi:MAG: sugar phosphate isomerase/epimerase [Desulfobacterales bacterium]|nr:MAG: sugar phosphate isomerase/epimerase [Desulfobacterales bacterium]
MPIIGLSTYSLFLKMGYRQAIAFAVDNGFKGVEIWSNAFDFAPGSISQEAIDQIKRIAEDRALMLAIHFCAGNDLAEINKGHLEESRWQLRETIRICSRIGGKVVIVHPGQSPRLSIHNKNPLHRYPRFQLENLEKQALVRFKESLADATKLAEDVGVTIGLENFSHVGNSIQSNLEDIVEWVDNIASPALQITLDIGHANLEGGVEKAITTYGSRIVHIHISDNDGRSSAHGEIGSGTIDWKEIGPFLRSFPGMLSLEILGFEDPEGAVLRSKDFLALLLNGR